MMENLPWTLPPVQNRDSPPTPADFHLNGPSITTSEGERETTNSTPNKDTAKTTRRAKCRPKRLATCLDPMAKAKTAVNTRTRYTAEMICEVSDTENGGQWQKKGTAETNREVSDTAETTREASDNAKTTREVPSTNSTFDLPRRQSNTETAAWQESK